MRELNRIVKKVDDKLNFQRFSDSFIYPEWRAPKRVRALITTRKGGVSRGVFSSLNVGLHVGDDAESVLKNRAMVQQEVSVPVAYLNQVHGTTVVQATDALDRLLDADAVVDNTGQAACAVMTADCLPVLFCDRAGTVVAAAHAGWRGLAAGVLQNTIRQMNVPTVEIMAYLGPAIGAEAFEVGQEVYDAFVAQHECAHEAFQPLAKGKYLADIYFLARKILRHEGVTQISGGDYCTVLERDTFFSYRRDGQTGRMVSAIWLDK